MRGKIEKDIFSVYDESNNLLYSIKIKTNKEFVYFDKKMNKEFLPLLKKTIAKGKVLVADYDKSLIGFGFKNPQMCSKKGICLYLGDDDAQDKDTIQREYEFLSTQLNTEHCEIVLKIDEKAISKLKKIISENKDETKEIFGSFKIINNKKERGNIVHTIDIIDSSLKSGSTDDVSATPTIYNFHTHPVSAYKMYDVKYGPPSVQDYKSIYLLCKDYNCIVHLIASIEGIYIVYLLPGVTGPEKKIITAIEKQFKYDDKKMDLQNYLQTLNNVGIFSISLREWTDAGLRTGIKIQFKKSGEWGNCKIRD